MQSQKEKATLTLLEHDVEQEYEFSEANRNEFDSRWEDYLSGKTKSISLEESKNNITKYIERKRKIAI